MIGEDTVAEIRRLLADGSLSQRKIAGLTHVSRGTVSAIASGRRPQYDAADRRRLGGADRAARAMSRVRRDGLPAMSIVPRERN